MSSKKTPIKITAEMIAESLTAHGETSEQTKFDQNDALALLVVQQQSMMKMMKKMVKNQVEREEQRHLQEQDTRQTSISVWSNCVSQAQIFIDQIFALSRYVSCNPASFLSSIQSVDCSFEQDLELGLGGDNY